MIGNKHSSNNNIAESSLQESEDKSNIQESLKNSKANVERKASIQSKQRLNKRNSLLSNNDKLNSNSDLYKHTTNMNLKSKRKREEETNKLEPGSLLEKISNYLKYITKSISVEVEVTEKETILRVMSYLDKYNLENPIGLLKVRNALNYILLYYCITVLILLIL